MKKAIVTGADGFIGSNLVRELISENYDIYAVVINIAEAEKNLENNDHIHYIECDMNNYSSLTSYNELLNADYLFHFAWAGTSGELRCNYEIQINNVKCSCDLQYAAKKLKIKRIIFADSIMEFEHIKAVKNEYYNLPLSNTYHISKYSARNYIQLMCNNSDIDFISVLISNVYGVGENSARLINTAIKNMLNRKHMRFTSAEQMYDFIYITDAVRAIRLAAEKGKNNKEYYIGNLKPHSLKYFLYEMRDAIAPDMELGIGELVYCGVSLDYTEFNKNDIYEDLGFIPQVTFKEGINMTVNWINSDLHSGGK